MPDLVALLIFVVTLAFILLEPWRVPGAVSAAVGAIGTVLLGRAQGADVLRVLDLTWDAVLTLIGLILLSIALQANGFFRWAALHMVGWSRGHQRVLLLLLIGLTALVAAVLANDGAVLIMTPLTWELMEVLKIEGRGRFACLFAVGFVCDGASMPLLVSNLTNILFADSFGLGFIEFARAMALPTLLVLASSTLMLLALFWKDLESTDSREMSLIPEAAIQNRRLFAADWTVLAVLAAAYLGISSLHLPVALVVLPAGLGIALLSVGGKLLTLRSLLSEGPWSILLFAVGLFIVVIGLFNGGWFAHLQPYLSEWVDSGNVLASGLLIGGLSALLNNLPTGLITILMLKATMIPPELLPRTVYAAILGTNIGCKLTPIGSLSTLLWLGLLRERGYRIGWGQYLRYSVPLSIVTLLAGLIGLFRG